MKALRTSAWLRALAHSAPVRALVERWERAGEPVPLLRVLTYHRVAPPDERPDLAPHLAVRPEHFEAHVRLVVSRYRPVSLEEVLDAVEGRRPLPPRAVLVTFDDAYIDFARHAWPVLRREGVPVVLFVPTAYPGDPSAAFWWDRLYHALHTARHGAVETPLGRLPLRSPRERRRAYRRLRAHVKALPHDEAMRFLDALCARLGAPAARGSVLDWEGLRRLAGEGVTLAPHSRTHPLFNRIPPERARLEALCSWADLVRHVGPVPRVFAYPSGGVNGAVVGQLARAKFRLAFTTERGINDLRAAHPLRLRRLNVGAGTTLPLLRVQLVPQVRYLSALQAAL